VAGLDIADVGECDQLIEPLRGMTCHGLQQEPDMISDIELVEDPAREPPDRVTGGDARPDGLPAGQRDRCGCVSTTRPETATLGC
jgi:hypothetical protein